MKAKFEEIINSGYSSKGKSIEIGSGVIGGEVIKEAKVKIPLATLNRHGLVAGATGTGKTKTLQKLAELLSENGVPSLVMDMKGDFSGISQTGELTDKVKVRAEQIGYDWQPDQYPVEFLTLGENGGDGVRLRATVSEFGPVLFSKMLELENTQSSVMSLIFKYCDDMGLPLLDLDDIKQTLKYLQTAEGEKEITKEYGKVSPATIGVILRKIIELEEQGAEEFFGEPSFEVNDLLRTKGDKGIVHVLRLMNMNTKPKLFSTFMLALLAEMYSTYPEEGDMDKPKLVVFVDEAHLLFDEASKALLDQIEQIVKLIRSKGVGIIFCTQNPIDIPDDVLAQLGLKIQHALRAFTAKDRDSIRKASENYPETDFYKVEDLITQLGIGEAFVTALSENGTPTPLVHTMMAPPRSRMDTITDEEFEQVIKSSEIRDKYKDIENRESAYEKLCKKMECDEEALDGGESVESKTKKAAVAGGVLGTMIAVSKNPLVKQVARTATSAAIRGILGMLTKRK